MQKGVFTPPSFALDKTYEGLQGLVAEARAGLAGIVVSAGKVLMLDRARIIEALEDTGLFLLGRTL